MKKENKKQITLTMWVLLLSILAVIPGSAVCASIYIQDATFNNVFTLGSYEVKLTEESFTPQADWLPGETLDKDVYVKNTGTLDTFVRLKIEESWSDTNGNHDGDTNRIIKNWTSFGLNKPDGMTNDTYWTFNPADGYYYYNYILKAGESIQILDSVKLDPVVTNVINGFHYVNSNYLLTFTEEDLLAEPFHDSARHTSLTWSMKPAINTSTGVITWTPASTS